MLAQYRIGGDQSGGWKTILQPADRWPRPTRFGSGSGVQAHGGQHDTRCRSGLLNKTFICCPATRLSAAICPPAPAAIERDRVSLRLRHAAARGEPGNQQAHDREELTMTAMTKRLARAVLIAGLALPVTTLLPANAPFAISKAHAEATTMAEFKSILANYGKWGTHEKYGAIWVPTVT